jgi:hypothetical protein
MRQLPFSDYPDDSENTGFFEVQTGSADKIARHRFLGKEPILRAVQHF